MKKLLLTVLTLSTILFAQSGVKSVDNNLYIKECGSCHFGFQTGLLAEKSWVKIMNNLENHFGTDAFIGKENYNAILSYLKTNSSEKAMEYKRSRRMRNSISSHTTPIKITEVRYFRDKHDEIPSRIINQKEVRILSNCMSCQTRAEKGSYSEREISIPNYGRWDD
ncbi:diheme cytochrome c [Arcobacteraceae bacterium]|nr:diheme cytochrome c [Arcobacteraceae bacterium]